jgi:hypothetical protein
MCLRFLRCPRTLSSSTHQTAIGLLSCNISPRILGIMTVTVLLRFYQRIVLTFVIFYTIVSNLPFLRGLLAWIVCMAILALDVVCVLS